MNSRNARCFGILCLLMDGRRRSYPELAEEFGVTAPTICKDVAELSIYYPLVTYCGWNGGVELDMTCVVNGQILSREEGALVLQSLNRIYLSEPSEELFVLIDKLQKNK